MKNSKIVNQAIYSINESWNDVISKEIPENDNPNKIFGIVEKALNFNNHQKSKGHKTLTPKQTLQRLPIALTQVKAGNTSENYPMKSIKPYIPCIEQKKLLKKYITI